MWAKIIILAVESNIRGVTKMKVGIPQETKNNENRVGITPAGVVSLVHAGHEVIVEHHAGEGAGYPDSDYE
ncbi:hypothetical protein HMPREF0495_00874 [Levilactobacillus brevis ATCC 14869 = DSM 20054]|uniref:Alanine dehydrogenase/pyridine nucleotide transhydrogenase N-terminal domain-containing protein n=1 Tax=Levilactobacillus brevis ATCC 14869 = DSM 20054 TaxID=649758 RepID=U2PL85_LEVBR|nr:hypothetical protein HMPREF0495_00874 [Levilactobacillus brevis ATCC 14869 = DSM 20054]